MTENVYHTPALLEPTLDLLNINPEGIYVDATFGGGGHSRAILQRLGPTGRLFGFDRDIDAFQNAPDDPRFTFVHSDYRFIPNFLRFHGVDKVDAMLAGIKMPKHREALTRRYIDGEDWPEILEALGIKEKRKAPALHKCALRAANRSLERLGGS